MIRTAPVPDAISALPAFAIHGIIMAGYRSELAERRGMWEYYKLSFCIREAKVDGGIVGAFR
jgi:hypothetical protein